MVIKLAGPFDIHRYSPECCSNYVTNLFIGLMRSVILRKWTVFNEESPSRLAVLKLLYFQFPYGSGHRMWYSLSSLGLILPVATAWMTTSHISPHQLELSLRTISNITIPLYLDLLMIPSTFISTECLKFGIPSLPSTCYMYWYVHFSPLKSTSTASSGKILLIPIP